MSGEKPPDPPPPPGAVGGVPGVTVNVNSSVSAFSSSTVTTSVAPTMATSEGGTTTTSSSTPAADTSIRMDTTENTGTTPTLASIVNPYAGVEQRLIIFLTKEENSRANYRCNTGEMAKLIFTHLKIPSDNVITFEQGKMNEIWVHTKGINVDDYKVPAQIKVKEGLYTMPMRAFRRPVKVSVDWARYKTPDACIIKLLSHFGEVADGKVYDHFHMEGTPVNKCTEEEKLIKGKPNGNKWVHLFMDRDIPSYGLLEGPDENEDPWRVRIHYGRQPATCARCHQGRRGCKGGANASKCQKKGGKAVDFEDFWNVVIANTVQHDNARGAMTLGNRIRLEGFAKNTKKEDVLEELINGIIHREIAEEDIKWNDKKMTLTINDVTHAEINTAVVQVSGTQWKGRTIWVTPILVPAARKILSRSPDAQETNESLDKDDDAAGQESSDESSTEGTSQTDTTPPVTIHPDAMGGAGPGAVLMSTLRTGKVQRTKSNLSNDDEQRKKDLEILDNHDKWIKKISEDPMWEKDSLGRAVERGLDNNLLKVYNDDVEKETFMKEKERFKEWKEAMLRENKRQAMPRRKILKKQAEANLQRQAEEEKSQEDREREEVEREKEKWEEQRKKGFGKNKKSPRSDSGRESTNNSSGSQSPRNMSRVSASGLSPVPSRSTSPDFIPEYGFHDVTPPSYGQNLLDRLESVMTPNTVPDTPREQGELKQIYPDTPEKTGAEEEMEEEAENDVTSINISEEEDSIEDMLEAYVTNTGKKKDRKRTASQSPQEPGVQTRSRRTKSSKMSGGGAN